MPHMFYRTDENWDAKQLVGECALLLPDGPRPADPGIEQGDVARLLCVRGESNGARAWAIVAVAVPVLINGQPLAPLGLRVLNHRDEIRFEASTLFFSAEKLPVVEIFAGREKPVHCARCKTLIQPQTEIVCCPGCGVLVHQTARFPCWTGTDDMLFPTCPLCDNPTAMTGYRWIPEL